MSQRVIHILDTTLRDGEQTPGVNLETKEKLEIAEALARLNVDIIEAGFPIASPGDFQAVSAVAAQVKGPVIAALARASSKDIQAAAEALKQAERPRIHTFIATSDLHLAYKLKMNRDEVLAAAVKAVKEARRYVGEVEFSAEDASRSDWDFLCQVYSAVIAAGAAVINVPDTVGYTTPAEYGKLIRYIREHVAGIEKAKISVHCHDDLGMAVANSLAAVENGADQVECCINGLGERAGNAALEEVVLALATRNAHYQAGTAIDTRQIYRTSRLVSSLSGILMPPNKAITGDNAFAHESGIHQHGVMNNSLTYEIISPETVGISRNHIVLGKHSGRHAFEERLKSLGYSPDETALQGLFTKFKELADRKKEVYDRDIEALVADSNVVPAEEEYRLVSHQVVSGSQTIATASVRLAAKSGTVEAACCGFGPVDAMFKAIEMATGQQICLKDYQIKAVTSGEDALGEATVWVAQEERTFSGRGLSTDIIEASAKAYVNAINKMFAACGYPAEKQKQAAGGK